LLFLFTGADFNNGISYYASIPQYQLRNKLKQIKEYSIQENTEPLKTVMRVTGNASYHTTYQSDNAEREAQKH